MREADLSMIEDVERRAVREWCSKNDKRQILLAAQFRKYQDIITDFWRDLLPE